MPWTPWSKISAWGEGSVLKFACVVYMVLGLGLGFQVSSLDKIIEITLNSSIKIGPVRQNSFFRY